MKEITNKFSLMPTSFNEALQYADLISKSSFCPVPFKNKSSDVLIAVQMGSEIGLHPIQSLQNIAVINGKPSIYGDAMLALCRNHKDFLDIEESGDTKKATCTVKRTGQSDCVRTFTMEDAQAAGLWGKAGPWKTYPARMLQMRARGFALRDSFTDALMGLISAEEAQDYPVKEKFNGNIEAQSTDFQLSEAKENVSHLEFIAKEHDRGLCNISAELNVALSTIENSKNIQELEENFKLFYAVHRDNKERKMIVESKDVIKSELLFNNFIE